ncbi:alkylhydroperoxidase domain protein [Leucobacter luti]|uniref:alkylhydroperoxidase domain protein n=1 Tax=Leucobacter luti TaxID=340320 RepID=UPI003CFBD939
MTEATTLTQAGTETDTQATDALDVLVGIAPGSALAAVRERRPEATAHAQGSFDALLRPVSEEHATVAERAAVALFVARLHGDPAGIALYGGLLRLAEGGEALEALIVAEAGRAQGSGPYGAFRAENAPESTEGPEYAVDSFEAAYGLGERLAAALEHAHLLVLHPRDASREALQALLDAGWSTTGIVTLSQLVAFLTFQLRVAAGLRAVAGPQAVVSDFGSYLRSSEQKSLTTPVGGGADAADAAAHVPEVLPAAPRVAEPPRFTREPLGWKPWLEPLPVAEFTERHYAALVERERVHMPYFRLLARDPEALLERTLTDLDIFFNTDEGLPRREREFAAAASSRFTGCVFCASVHARFAVEQGADPADVDALLDQGVSAWAERSGRLAAIVDATVALTATPPRFGAAEVARLRAEGLGELELLDAIQSAAFFNWANRLMLSLGEPTA